MDINAAGQMLGFANCPNNPIQQRLRWRADGTLVPTQPGWPNMALNDGGHVAGVARVGNESGPAIQHFEGGAITMLEDGGTGFASVSDMTSYGYIVGNVNRSTNDSPPFLPAGWIGPYVFPLSYAADAWGTAVSEPGWALLEVREQMRSYGVLVGPRGAVVTLHHTQQSSDELVDMNDTNIVLGYRSEPNATGSDIYGAFYGIQGVVPLRSSRPAQTLSHGTTTASRWPSTTTHGSWASRHDNESGAQLAPAPRHLKEATGASPPLRRSQGPTDAQEGSP